MVLVGRYRLGAGDIWPRITVLMLALSVVKALVLECQAIGIMSHTWRTIMRIVSRLALVKTLLGAIVSGTL